MKNDIISYEKFRKPDNNKKIFNNKCLDIDEVYKCNYIIFFIIEHREGEYQDNYLILNNNINKDLFKNMLYKFYYDSYLIYAINILDNIVCEVI